MSYPDFSDEYADECRRYGVPVDPSVVITLKTRWPILQPTSGFTDGHLLPLIGVLSKAHFIHTLKLHALGSSNAHRVHGSGNSNARALRDILVRNKGITHLDVSKMGIDSDGLAEICEALKVNNSVRTLILHNNFVGPRGGELLQAALQQEGGGGDDPVLLGASALREVDVRNNHLGYDAVCCLQSACAGREPAVELSADGNFVFEEVLNSVTHGVGALLAIFGSILMASHVQDKSVVHKWGTGIYCASLLILYTSSTLFHSFFLMPRVAYILQKLDHIGIYLLIAGTVTPFMLVNLHGLWSGTLLLCAEWGVALVGVVLSVVVRETLQALDMFLYLLMGWALVLAYSDVMEHLSGPCLALIAAGGVTYTSGIYFFVKGNDVPIYHALWHCFVLVASMLHYLAVFFYVIPHRIPGYYDDVMGDEVVCSGGGI